MTTPESPRTSWPQRQFRLDDQSWKAVRVKLAADEKKWQGVMEMLARGWIAGEVDVDAVQERLKARGLLPEK